jgi:hypothetical protein
MHIHITSSSSNLNTFIQVLFTNMITNLVRTFKDKQNDDFQMK